MAPFYEAVCGELKWPIDRKMLETMKAANEAKLAELDVAMKDASENLGETDVRDFMLKTAEHLSRIGAKVCFSCSFLFFTGFILSYNIICLKLVK